MWTTTSGLRGKKLHLAITFTSVVGFSLFGYDQGLMSGIISGDQFTKEFPPLYGDSEHVAVLRGAVTSCYELGCFFGAIFTMMYGQRIGRTPLLVAGGLLMILCYLYCCVRPSLGTGPVRDWTCHFRPWKRHGHRYYPRLAV